MPIPSLHQIPDCTPESGYRFDYANGNARMCMYANDLSTGNDAKWITVYYPTEYYDNPSEKLPVMFFYGGVGEEINGSTDPAVGWSETTTWGPLQLVKDDTNWNYRAVLVWISINYSYGGAEDAACAELMQRFLDSNTRFDYAGLFGSGLSAGNPNPMLNQIEQTTYKWSGLVVTAGAGSVSDTARWVGTNYWGIENTQDSYYNNTRVQYDALKGRPASEGEQHITMYDGNLITDGYGCTAHCSWRDYFPEATMDTAQLVLTGNGHADSEPANTNTNTNTFKALLANWRRSDITNPPNPVTDLTASVVNGNEISLTWTNNDASQTNVEIWRKKSTEAAWYKVQILAGNTTSVSDYPEEAGDYDYEVIPTNSAGSATSYEYKSVTGYTPPIFNNSFITLTLSDNAYGDNAQSAAITDGAFAVTFNSNGGTGVDLIVESLEHTAGSNTVKIYGKPIGRMNGNETLTVTPVTDRVFDSSGTAMSTSVSINVALNADS